MSTTETKRKRSQIKISFLRVLCVLVATILFVLKAQPAKAAPPCDELLRLVPSDAGFVIVIQDVRGHFDRIGKSPFAKPRCPAKPTRPS